MDTGIGVYRQKRDFARTCEPEGITEGSSDALRFVVQHHMARSDHYDFRLEWQGVLLSWAVPKGPSYSVHEKRLAIQVENHPIAYREFEGTIPRGEYGGGTVMLWDEGYWEPRGDVEEGLKAGQIKMFLDGRRLKGKWALIRLKAKEGEKSQPWLLMKEKDAYVKNEDGISEFITSIRTGRTMEEIEKGETEKITRNPFENTHVQLAKLVSQVPSGEDWLYELKYDGFRIAAFVEGNHARLMTRNGQDYTGKFYRAAQALVELAAGRAMVLDGEMTVTDTSGKTNFQALQDYMKDRQGGSLTYILFDLLALDGEDFRNHPLMERKRVLEELLVHAPANLYYSRHVRGGGKDCFTAACKMGMEGIIGKKPESVYSGTRNGDWIKLKCGKRQEFVIGGYTISEKHARDISSLLLGVYKNGVFMYVGRAGTGFREADIKMLMEKFADKKRMESPFILSPKPRGKETLIWLEPELVAEIKFAEWTREHLLRQASFKGLRTDKSPRDVKPEDSRENMKEDGREEVQSEQSEGEKEFKKTDGGSIIIEGVHITNPDKVMFEKPQVTKGDIVRYYAEVSKRMLPYVGHRLLSIVCCPKGITQTSFFKKHPSSGSKGIVTFPVSADTGEVSEYFYVEDLSGLLSETQRCAVEFHTWGSSVRKLEKPDVMVFDLDPDEGMEISQVRQGARDVRNILAELSLNSYLKTSGGKGYHVVVPFQPGADWETFYGFAKQVAIVMEQKWPDRYTSNVRKAKRKNRIFIDWIRNGRGATSVAPYSIRAREGAKVSMPIQWGELDNIAPDGIDMNEALRRITGEDPWKDFFQNNQMLSIKKTT
nr:DNA ligase D [Novisyntrophococcus fermenticellae]